MRDSKPPLATAECMTGICYRIGCPGRWSSPMVLTDKKPRTFPKEQERRDAACGAEPKKRRVRGIIDKRPRVTSYRKRDAWRSCDGQFLSASQARIQPRRRKPEARARLARKDRDPRPSSGDRDAGRARAPPPSATVAFRTSRAAPRRSAVQHRRKCSGEIDS